jgi:hypothetical protein
VRAMMSSGDRFHSRLRTFVRTQSVAADIAGMEEQPGVTQALGLPRCAQ